MSACFSYTVPGLVVVLRQPSSLMCWATAYTMMVSWNDQRSHAIRDAVAQVDARYGALYDANRGLPPAEFTSFLRAAGMRREPMWSITLEAWLELLEANGMLWVGTLGVVNPGQYLHSRLIEGMYGDGSGGGTRMKIIDPENGGRYEETFDTFLTRYEGARRLSTANEYYQIRHF